MESSQITIMLQHSWAKKMQRNALNFRSTWPILEVSCKRKSWACLSCEWRKFPTLLILQITKIAAKNGLSFRELVLSQESMSPRIFWQPFVWATWLSFHVEEWRHFLNDRHPIFRPANQKRPSAFSLYPSKRVSQCTSTAISLLITRHEEICGEMRMEDTEVIGTTHCCATS